jgi:exosome complex component RRP41
MIGQTSMSKCRLHPLVLENEGEEEKVTGMTLRVSFDFSVISYAIPLTRRILEMAAAIKSTFEPVIQTSLYPRSQIDIFVQVLQQDGGLLQACINATTLALVTAGIPLLDFVCAVTGGVHSTSPLLDLTLLEENDLPNVTVAVMPRTQKVTLVTMETRLHVDRFEEIFRVSCEAGSVIHKEMKRAIQARTGALVAAMGSVTGAGREDKDGDDRMEGF